VESGLLYALILIVPTAILLTTFANNELVLLLVYNFWGLSAVRLSDIRGRLTVAHIFQGLFPTLMIVRVGLGVDTTTVTNSLKPKSNLQTAAARITFQDLEENRANTLAQVDLPEAMDICVQASTAEKEVSTTK
jgi:hypothetical protein